MSLRRLASLAFAVPFLWSITDIYAATEVDPRLKEFAKLKRQQTEDLAAKLHLDVPPEAREFFKAAEAGDWIAVSNSFERIRPQSGTNGPLTKLKNVLYVPVHETFGAYAEFNQWDGGTLQKFADGVLNSLSPGSIYFGGSGWGRFIITAVRDVAQAPDVLVISQNPMVDSLYTGYLQQLYGSRVWVPNEQDVQQAIQQGGEGVKDANFWMNVIGALTKAVFDHKKAQHEFYVQESFVISWMYPYLEPHGLIMKLNKESLKELDPAVVARDRQYWGALTKQLLADSRFLHNESGRQAFAKLRSAIGGIYIYRQLTGEAEAAFKQAIELGQTMPEGPFRLTQLYVEQKRYDDAVAVMEHFQSQLGQGPDKEKVLQAVAQIREMKRKAAEKPPQ